MNDLVKKALSLGVGITVVSKEKIESVVNDLVKRGEMAPNQSKELIQRLMEKGEAEQAEWKELLRQQLKNMLAELQVATHEDIEKLSMRLEKLENQAAADAGSAGKE